MPRAHKIGAAISGPRIARAVPSDGLRRYCLPILKTQGKSEAQMPLKQGSNASVPKLPFQQHAKPALGTARIAGGNIMDIRLF